CRMEFNPQGKAINHEIFESVINSDYRMTYKNVNLMLEDEDAAVISEFKEVYPRLKEAEELAQILRNKREKRGAIDFDFDEAAVVVGEDGTPEDIVLRTRGTGEKMIEEFMLAANETVAEHFYWMDVPFMYRIHENPKEEKLSIFFDFLTGFGVVVKGKGIQIHPHALQRITEEVKGRPEEMVIATLMLRSMQQAKYSPESLGHFGLSTEYYTHFTSPIRRYPDLIVHRLIREYLIQGKTDAKTIRHNKSILPDIAKHTSERERRAQDAERDTDDLKKAEFMMKHVGEKFEGVVAGVMNFGMFVELPNTIEGLVLSSLLFIGLNVHAEEVDTSKDSEQTKTENTVEDKKTKEATKPEQVEDLEVEKETVASQISALEYLDAATRDDYVSTVMNAQDLETIQAILSQATAENDYLLQEYKKEQAEAKAAEEERLKEEQ